MFQPIWFQEEWKAPRFYKQFWQLHERRTLMAIIAKAETQTTDSQEARFYNVIDTETIRNQLLWYLCFNRFDYVGYISIVQSNQFDKAGKQNMQVSDLTLCSSLD